MKPRIRIKPRGGAYLGEIDLPLPAGRMRVSTLGWDPRAALRRAASAALQVATDPAMATILPPHVTAAAHAAKAISKLDEGELRDAARTSEDPSERKLAGLLARLLGRRRELGEVKRRDMRRSSSTRKGELQRRARRQHRRLPGRASQGKVRAIVAPHGEVVDVKTGTRITAVPHEEPGTGLPPGWTTDEQGNPIAPAGWPTDQYGNPLPWDSYGNPIGQGQGYGHGGDGMLQPIDYQAMAVWGSEAFHPQEEEMQMDDADRYFQAYEEGHEDEGVVYEDEGEGEDEGDGGDDA